MIKLNSCNVMMSHDQLHNEFDLIGTILYHNSFQD